MSLANRKTQIGFDQFNAYLKKVISVHPQLLDLSRRLPNRTLFETVRDIGRRLDRKMPIIYPDVWATQTRRQIDKHEWHEMVHLLQAWCEGEDNDDEGLSPAEARRLALSLMWTTIVLDELALRIKKDKGYPAEFPE